ncbi:flagellar biosynthesis chaperone FliJ [Bacillus sp. AGMB 02131]|uniref:Flagellar FliJ protein n=1 Tax=Peribacillus faecalis TaxID=2772559 RepID=A0A927CXB8_9BACI|nr:flagellar export protein FliJ [Peribacillus faecalis]MBD3109443.1 flagellar biosynthesis chaperone FliJ [Peribacillus faecalis]
MGSFQYKFEKILAVREKEKADAQAKYSESVNKFEEVANKLYKLLKKKEDLLDYQQEKMIGGLSVIELRQHQVFLDNVEKTIAHCQQQVIVARQRMEAYQAVLIERNIEVKKYVKIKEKQFERFVKANKAQESIQMDDISIQTFISKED